MTILDAPIVRPGATEKPDPPVYYHGTWGDPQRTTRFSLNPESHIESTEDVYVLEPAWVDDGKVVVSLHDGSLLDGKGYIVFTPSDENPIPSYDELEELTFDLDTGWNIACRYLHDLERMRCVDCQVDTTSEYYMVLDHLWEQAGMDVMGGTLCIGCLESRLGRTLIWTDFNDYPVNCTLDDMGSARSERLLSRLCNENKLSAADLRILRILESMGR